MEFRGRGRRGAPPNGRTHQGIDVIALGNRYGMAWTDNEMALCSFQAPFPSPNGEMNRVSELVQQLCSHVDQHYEFCSQKLFEPVSFQSCIKVAVLDLTTSLSTYRRRQ